MPSQRTVAPRIARRINDRIVLDVLLRHGPLSRGQIRDQTGMSQPSTIELIDRLIADRLIEPAGQLSTKRRGPNAMRYGIVAGRAHVAVARVSAWEEVAAAIADITGAVVGHATGSLQDVNDPVGAVLDTLRAAATGAGLEPGALHHAVVGVPGTVDPATGDAEYVADLPGWRGSIRAPLEQRLGRAVRLENQMNLAGIAEHHAGAAADRDSFVLLSVDRGGGMAVVLNGRLWRGASGGAGELAYLPAAGAPVTAVDQTDNSFTGGYSTLVTEAALDEVAARHGLPGTAVTAVREAVAADDHHDFLADVARRIAIGAAATVSVLDPGLVVLTGGVGQAGGATLADLVAAQLAAISPLPTEVRPAQVTGDPVLTGAVTVALERVHRELWGPRTTFDHHR